MSKLLRGGERALCAMLTVVSLAACGGGGTDAPPPPPPSGSMYSVGGAVTGLGAGKTVTLRNGTEPLRVNASGPFVFTTKYSNNNGYAVQVQTNPTGQTCAVSNGSGTINGANVSNVNVTCANTVAGVWDHFDIGQNAAGKATLTLFSSEPLLVNSPFYGIEVRKNDVDITDDIVHVEVLTNTSWRYTFGTQVLNTAGATLSVSLQNKALATPGHYVAARGYGKAADVQGTYQLLVDCQAGVGDCASVGAMPGLLSAIKGVSSRYEPRSLETAQGVYNFSTIFNDAAFLASKGKKLHVMFTVKTFSIKALYTGDGSNRYFDIPSNWDGDRTREVHVYVKDYSGAKPKFVETTAFTINKATSPRRVELATAPPAPPAPLPGDPVDKNVLVSYARDPFPEYTWQMNPSMAAWFEGTGGPSTGNDVTGSQGFVHKPWEKNCVDWMRNFMAAFQKQWIDAIAAGTVPADAIEAVSIQETANSLVNSGNAQAYRAGLLEYAKFNARAVRRRALHGQLFNQIPGGGIDPMTGLAVDSLPKALSAHARSVIPWGARLEGPDLFNDEASLEDKVYQVVHRDLREQALTMIWQQNASYSEPHLIDPITKVVLSYYSPLEQFVKAQLGALDMGTASGKPGLESEYVFWNLTVQPASAKTPYDWKDALKVIAAHPAIQTTGNDRYRWRRAAGGAVIADQSLSKVNP